MRIRRIFAHPLRVYIGLALLIVGLLRSNILPLPMLRNYAEPSWLYGVAQLVAGLGLLLTTHYRVRWFGRLASVVAVAVTSMLAYALTTLFSTGAVWYALAAGMLLVAEGGTDGR
jgi:hypothetical protein